MRIIRTVNGDINEDELKWCQCHEHLLIEKCKSYDVDNNLYVDDVDKSLFELSTYIKAGGKSIVDAQPYDSGRMAENLPYISKKANANIVAVTGFHKKIFYYNDSYLFNQNVSKISEFYISEIEQGMLSSKKNGRNRLNSKAGLVKAAVESGDFLKGEYAKLFEACANAAYETGASVFCHLDKDADAIGVINYFVGKGIKPEKIILCHLDRAKYDFDYHRDVLSCGVYLEYDTIQRLKYHSNKQEIELIMQMIVDGYEKQILLGLDTTRARLKAYGAKFGLDFILTEFIDRLKEYGVKEKSVESFMINNPKNALSIEKL